MPADRLPARTQLFEDFRRLTPGERGTAQFFAQLENFKGAVIVIEQYDLRHHIASDAHHIARLLACVARARVCAGVPAPPRTNACRRDAPVSPSRRVVQIGVLGTSVCLSVCL